MLLTGCGSSVDYGNINKVDQTESKQQETEKIPKAQFNATKSHLSYSYEHITIGRAKMILPYPKGWDVSKTTDYDIKFSAPKDDPYFPNANIYFHSTLEMKTYYDTQHIMEEFEEVAQTDKFYFYGDMINIRPSSEVEEYAVDSDISKAEYNLHLTYRDYDANVQGLKRGKDHKPYYQRTVFTWYSTPCILSGIVDESQADNLNDLLLYMMSNCSYINEKLTETQKVTIKTPESKISFPLSPLYKETSADTGDRFDHVSMFACDANSGTGHSHSSIALYEAKKSKFKKIDNETFAATYLDLLLDNHFGVTSDDYEVYGYIDLTMNSSVDFNGKNTKEYVYRFDWGPMDVGELEGCFANQSWIIALYPIEYRDKIELLILTTPDSGLIWSMECVELIAKYISFKQL